MPSDYLPPEIRALHALVGAQVGPAPPNSVIGEVIRSYRPAWPHKGTNFATLPPPKDFDPSGGQAIAAVVDKTAASVGCVLITSEDGSAKIAAGTCFRVGSTGRLVATAGHVLKGLLNLQSTPVAALPFDATNSSGWALRQATVRFEVSSLSVPIKRVRFCHGRWDLMVIELVDDGQALPSHLPIEEEEKWARDSEPVIVLGYPDLRRGQGDQFLQAYGANPQNGLYVAPGFLTAKSAMVPDVPADLQPLAIDPDHDASTLPGFSGGPVVSLATGRVVGVHYRGGEGEPDPDAPPNDLNDAVHLQAALRGPRVRAILINGTPDDQLPPSNEWDEVGSPPNWNATALEGLEGGPPDPIADLVFAGLEFDRPDFRDLPYVPGLAVLPQRHIPPPPEGLLIRHQGASRACTGFALATAIDRQLARAQREVGPVSSRMLYEAALSQDEWIDRAAGGSSLRGAIKGFFQNGVCLDDEPPWDGTPKAWRLNQVRGHAAREVTLGAYRNVPHDLFATQAAIYEAGAVLVSARVHDGWLKPKALKGSPLARIKPKEPDPTRSHAFVLVGYDEKGFVVQNSAGASWGTNGLALWTYEDWEASLIDAWVLTLAPGHPRAFDMRPRAAATAPRGPRRYSLIGHIAQTEADGFVNTGPLGSGLDTLRETGLFLATAEARAKYPRIAFVLHDPFLGADAVARISARLIQAFKATKPKTYVIHLVHGLDEAETIRLRVMHEAIRAGARYGADLEALSGYIERRIAGILARPWRLFLDGLDAAVQPGKPVWTALAAILLEARKDKKRQDREVRLLAIGAGSELAQSLHRNRTLTSLHGKGGEWRDPTPPLFVTPTLPLTAINAWGGTVFEWEASLALPPTHVIPGYRGDWPDLLMGRQSGDGRAPGLLGSAFDDPAFLKALMKAFWPSHSNRN